MISSTDTYLMTAGENLYISNLVVHWATGSRNVVAQCKIMVAQYLSFSNMTTCHSRPQYYAYIGNLNHVIAFFIRYLGAIAYCQDIAKNLSFIYMRCVVLSLVR